MLRLASILLLVVGLHANAAERDLKHVGHPHGLLEGHVPLIFSTQPSKPASTTPAARASKKATTQTINYVSANKFATKDCSGSSTLIGIVQNTCIPNFDLSTSPPTQLGYQIYTVNKNTIVLTDYAMSDTACKGAPSAPQALAPGRCYPISATLSYTFSTGSTPSTLPSIHGLFYASYSSLAACQKLDNTGLIAISQLTSTYAVPSQFWNEPIKLTCAAPDLVEIVALPPSTTPAASLNLGKCTTEAAGGYAIRLGCYL